MGIFQFRAPHRPFIQHSCLWGIFSKVEKNQSITCITTMVGVIIVTKSISAKIIILKEKGKRYV
jgi:hypothetical protein